MKPLAVVAFLFLSLPLFAQTADVRVFAQTGRPVLPGGEVADMTVPVQNVGPDLARNVRVEFRATAGAKLDTVHGVNCTWANDVAVCNYGDLTAGPTQYANIRYQLPLGEGKHTITATVSSDTPDPDPANNSASIEFTSTTIPAVYAFLWPASARIDPGQRTTFETRVIKDLPVPAGTPIDVRWSLPAGTIETIDAPPSWSCSNSGAQAECTFAATEGELESANVTVRASDDPKRGTVVLHAEAAARIEGRDAPGAHDIPIQVYRHLVVTSTADAGPGSLRDAIAEANANCAQPCKMLFDIPAPAEIVPATPLPPLRADRIVIDATTAPAPVILDGRAAGEGLEVHAGCDAIVRGLTLRNFSANQALWLTSDGICISGEHDQVLVERNTIESNLRGLRLDGAPRPVVRNNVIRDNRYSGVWMWTGGAWLQENRIENNGASGIFLGPQVGTATITRNTISGHPHMGVAVAYGARDVEIRANTMRDNRGLGIDWGLDGPTAPRDDDTSTHGNAPVLLSAVYDASRNVTVVTVAMHTRPLYQLGGLELDLFADGEPVATAYHAPYEGTRTVDLHADLRGKSITATASRWIEWSELGGTSETSNSVTVD